jgi:hypothetical protein
MVPASEEDAMMLLHFLIRRAEQAAGADKSAVGAINRSLRMTGLVC